MEIYLYYFSYKFVRALGLIVFLPFDYFTVGIGIRFIIAALLALSANNYDYNISELTFLSYPQEFMLGFIVALPVLLLIQAADLWGDLFESLRGQTIGTIADPLFQGETSHLALLTKGLMWVGLIAIGVLETLYSKYQESFKLSALDLALWQKSILIFTNVLNSAMGFLIPLALCFLVIEIAAMLSAKILPGLSMFTEVFSVKLLLSTIGLLSLLNLEPLSSLKNILSGILIF